MTKIFAGLIFSYLLGSIPNAYIFAKLLKGIDLRKHGSGNLGATNAFRVLGKGIGTTVLVLDILKGIIAVLVASALFSNNWIGISRELYLCLAAIAVVSGHNWTIFLGFRGGKGMATSLGALIAFAILIPNFAWVVIISTVAWSVIFLLSGLVSLASVTCSAAIPFVALCFRLPAEIIIFLSILAGFSLMRHKANIKRLLEGKENRFNTRKIFKKR
jgi:acyl phosphate:glycerol-3-phosphate acyltransferase